MPLRVRIRGTKEYAGVVELADTYDLGSYVVRHAGSSPVARTISGVHNGFVMNTHFFYIDAGFAGFVSAVFYANLGMYFTATPWRVSAV